MKETVKHPWLDLQLATARLLLRPLTTADSAAVFAMGSDPEVMRYGSELPWSDPAMAEARIQRSLNAMQAGEYLTLAIVRQEDGAVIGECGLYCWSLQNRRAELGYRLRSDCWGSGYMQEALTALLDWAVLEAALHRVEADTDPANAASIRLLKKLGFMQEGILRERWIIGGRLFDTAMFGLLTRHWREMRGAYASGKSEQG